MNKNLDELKNAIEMSVFINEMEDNIADGMHIRDLDEKALKKAKETTNNILRKHGVIE